jgi:hypothetical protein
MWDDKAMAREALERAEKRRAKYGEMFESLGERAGFLVQRKVLRGRLQIVEGECKKSFNGGGI